MNEDLKKQAIDALNNCIKRNENELSGEYKDINWYLELKKDNQVLQELIASLSN